MNNPTSYRYLIESVTKSGARFRPSDWIDRLASWDATFDQHRLVFSERLHPAMLDGQKVLVIEPNLHIENAQMFESVLHFVERNNLKMHIQYEDGRLEEYPGVPPETDAVDTQSA
ncbi:MAG: DUF3579 domain-containing protein [Halothiobacillus sp.]|jgi:hypothetical protein|uniref:DUF3579 domain-containing protein n=1 Tax=Halothiobacillus sp. TaxID=1891311 RepID=UPI002AD2B3AF|nr:DUF3579 domain-containing protein [Halothiobacillus sp.]MDA3877660.1 DUF3579 domain-containing protein [Halothiobacillus sp.]